MPEFSAPGLMSRTSTVPAAVQSVFHSSLPWVPSVAAKNSVSQLGTRYPPLEFAGPGLTSFSIRVPSTVPSLT